MHAGKHRRTACHCGRRHIRVRQQPLERIGDRPGKLIWATRAAFGHYPHDCNECPNDPALRESWGCDRETPHPIDRTPHDTLHRCPYQVVPDGMWSVLRYSALARNGLWPVAGGALDQSQSFLDAHQIVTSELNTLEADAYK